jgi:hypothetical protein
VSNCWQRREFVLEYKSRREEAPINRQRAMKSLVNLELIFPIKDAPSASFMSSKARCLRDAGIISESEKHWVDARVLSVLVDPIFTRAVS